MLALAVLFAACGDNITSNRAPTASAFTLTTQEDLPVTRSADVEDLDGDTLVAAVPAPPDHGTVTIVGLSLTYTPEPDFHGSDQFGLVISDGEDTVSLTVDVTVTPVNDAAVGGNDSLATNEDTPRVVPVDLLLANDSDVDEDPLTITAVGDALNGTVALANGNITFTPAADFVGGGSFTYTLNDGTVDTVVDVDVVVGGINDAPVANDDSVTTLEDTAITIPGATLLANDTDVDGQTLTISAVSGAINGTVVLNGGSPIFTPDLDAATGSFVYTATDGIASDTATVTVTITAVNDGPDAINDTATTNEDTAVTITVLANDTDPDSTPTVSGVSNAQNGTPVANGDGTISFTPNANFHGTATFDYTITDGTLSDTATVTVTVNAVNDLPVAVDDSGSTEVATPITFTNLTSNDTDADIATDGQTLTVTAVANAVNGTVVLNGGQPIFTPTSTQNGSFEYTVSDGNGGTDTGLVTVTVTQPNVIPPTANADAVTQIDSATAFPHSTFLTNDSDGGDGGPLVITAVGNATNGTVTLEATTITFTPTVSSGAASFEYTLSDGNVVTSTGTVSITVVDCGDGETTTPEQCDDGNNDPSDGCSATCTVEPGFTCDNSQIPSVCTVAILAQFTFTGALGSEVTRTAETANGITAPVMSRSGVAPSAAAGAFSANGWSQSSTLDTGDFFSFTITPNTGGTTSLTRFAFDEKRSSSGPLQWVLRSSLDNFTSNLASAILPDDDLLRSQSFALPAAFLGVSTQIEFRIFGFDADLAAGTWRIDNVTVFGSATPAVP